MSLLLLRVFNRKKTRGNRKLRIYTVFPRPYYTTLAKLSYTIALIPHLRRVANIRRKEVDWLVLVFGIGVPH